MKSSFKAQSWVITRSRLGLAISAMAITFSFSSAWAATNSWIAGGNGSYTDPSKWTGGVNVPNGATDVAAIDGTNSVVGFNSTVTLQALNLALTASGGGPVFNQTGGALTVGTLGFGGAGGSRNPIYNLSGGTLSIATTFSWGNGSAAKFNVSAGTVDFSGSSLNVGVANGAKGSIIMTGGTFNANLGPQINLANADVAGAQAVVDLSGNAQFNATASTFVIGQFGAPTGTGVFATLNMAGTSQLRTSTVVLGGNNGASAVYGVINLNGGTLSAGSVRKGNGSIAASSTANVVHANGGTIKAVAHANNSNFFQNTFVDLQAGGLNFDTDSNNVTITNVLSGVGGLTKKGDGSLTLSNANTYTGDTTVSGGTLILDVASLSDSSTVSIATGTILNLAHGGQDQVAKIILNGVENTAPGTYGPFGSDAIFQSEFFEGTGVLRIGAASPGRDLTWTGVSDNLWQPTGSPNFTTNGVDSVAFSYNDNVTFNDSSIVTALDFFGMLYPGTVTFNGTTPYTLTSTGSPTGIAGSAGIVVNNTSSVSLGGVSSAFTGPISVNSGKLIALDNLSFGSTSGITIANGAQVDINGKAPGSLYTYTVAGTGPLGSGIIANGGVIRFGDAGIKNLILSGDASIGNDGNRFDIGQGGTVTGNSHTLTKVGTNDMGFRGDASGSPINIVVAAGNIWAETSANAFGGATGTLTIKSGARAGTYQTLTIATPVSIESGGTLQNQGAGNGTWTGAFTLAGNVSFETTGGLVAINGTVTGTANITKSGANALTIANPTYVGNTTVTSGPLTLTNTGLSDAGTVTLNGATSTLSLTHGTSDTVSKLFLDGVQQAAGTYVSTTNTQSIPGAIATAHIVGATGSLIVTTSPSADPFVSWASANITSPAHSGQMGRLDDADGDGFTNITEFLFGTLPESNTGSLTEITRSGANFILRWNERNSGGTYTLQESTTLAENPWPTSGVAPVTAGDQTGVPADYTRKQATIPIDSARKFARVNAVEN